MRLGHVQYANKTLSTCFRIKLWEIQILKEVENEKKTRKQKRFLKVERKKGIKKNRE